MLRGQMLDIMAWRRDRGTADIQSIKRNAPAQHRKSDLRISESFQEFDHTGRGGSAADLRQFATAKRIGIDQKNGLTAGLGVANGQVGSQRGFANPFLRAYHNDDFIGHNYVSRDAKLETLIFYQSERDKKD